MNWKRILRSSLCLLVVFAILLNCVPVKADALAVTGTYAIGVAACLILLSAGIVFNPQTVEDVNAMGNNFYNYMYQWGTEAEELDAVEEYFSGLSIVEPDNDDDWDSPAEKKIKIGKRILAGVMAWVYAIATGVNSLYNPHGPTTSNGYSGFRATMVKSARLSQFPGHFPFWEFAELAYRTESVIPVAMTGSYLWGFYWNKYGVLCKGIFESPYSAVHADNFTLIPLSDLSFASITSTANAVSTGFCYSQESVKSDPNYLTSSYKAIDWSYIMGQSQVVPCETAINVYTKSSTDSVFSSVKSSAAVDVFGDLINFDPPSWSHWEYRWHFTEFVYDKGGLMVPAVVGDVVPGIESGEIDVDDIPLQDIDYSLILPDHLTVLEGVQNVVQQFHNGDMTLEKYLELTKTADDGAETPTIVAGIPYGSAVTYYQNGVSSEIKILANVSDGGTLTYEWYRYGNDAEGKPYPVEILDTDNVFIPSTEDLGTSHYYCRVINTDPNGLVAYQHTSSIQVDVIPDPNADPDPGTDADPDPGTDPDSGNNPDASQDSIGDVKPATFWDSLKNTISGIFVPSQDYLTAKVDALASHFPFVTPIVALARTISLGFAVDDPEPPIIYLHLEDTRGSYNLGGTVPFIDMTWYAEYKPIGDALLSSLLWVVFIWRQFRQLPGLISGMPGEFNARVLDVLHISLPSRSMATEVQRQRIKETVRKEAKKK